MTLELSIAIGRYDRHQPLMDGRVKANGINLTFAAFETRDVFWRMLRYGDFDVAEMSLASYSIALGQGRTDLIAIPVFPSRFFRHGSIFVNVDAGIERPEDLRGKTVGTGEYQMTANVWVRGLLADEFGVEPTEFEWVTGGEERVPMDMPAGVALRRLPSQHAVAEALDRGDIAAMFSTAAPEPLQRGSTRIRRLFGDLKVREEDYFRRTKVFPIMHTVVVRRELYERHPWIARNLFDAFNEAKQIAYRAARAPHALPYTMPSLMHYLEEQRALYGDDPWPYGVDRNLPTLTTFQRYLEHQQLVPRAPTFEELFAANCLSEADPLDNPHR